MYQQPQQQYQQQYQAQPLERTYGEKIKRKAISGLINIPTAPLEIPKSIINNTNAEGSNIIYGVIGGVLEGTLNTVFRGTRGMIDLSTFLIPSKPVTSPEYVWDDFYDINTMYGDVFRLDENEKQPVFEMPK
jgi:putative exosortase-associated protein (TIGR04073 family)